MKFPSLAGFALLAGYTLADVPNITIKACFPFWGGYLAS